MKKIQLNPDPKTSFEMSLQFQLVGATHLLVVNFTPKNISKHTFQIPLGAFGEPDLSV
jgi:hypothetical protein